MILDQVMEKIKNGFLSNLEIYEREPGIFQIITPFCHEDGDLIEVYLLNNSKYENVLRVCDFGLSIMRLSYTFELNTDRRISIFDTILKTNDVQNDGGELYIDSTLENLFEDILKFVGCVQKICSMRFWK